VNNVINFRVVIKSKHVFTMLTLTASQIGRVKIIYLLYFVKSDSLNVTMNNAILFHTHTHN
jgi:aspartate/tyrosine/aromatic aminotransferase